MLDPPQKNWDIPRKPLFFGLFFVCVNLLCFFGTSKTDPTHKVGPYQLKVGTYNSICSGYNPGYIHFLGHL